MKLMVVEKLNLDSNLRLLLLLLLLQQEYEMVAMLEGTEVKMKMEIVMAMKKDKLVSGMDKNNSFVEEVVVEVEVETIIGG